MLTRLAQSLVNEHTITVFSKGYCPYCRSAKRLLQKEYADQDIEIVECVHRPLALIANPSRTSCPYDVEDIPPLAHCLDYTHGKDS